MAEAPPGEDQSGSPRMEDSMKKLSRICSSLALAVAIAACQGKVFVSGLGNNSVEVIEIFAGTRVHEITGVPGPRAWPFLRKPTLMVHIRLSSISETGRVSPGTNRVHSSASAVAFRR